MPYPGRNRLLKRGSRWTYWLRDLFSAVQAAPLTAAGNFRGADYGKKLSVTGGRLVSAGITAAGAPRILTANSYARQSGRSFFFLVNWAALRGMFGWTSSATPTGNPLNGIGDVSGALNYFDASGAVVASTLGINTDAEFAFVLRGTGGFLFRKVSGTTYRLMWVANTSTATPLWAGAWAVSTDFSVQSDDWKVLDLPAPFTTDYGLATNRLTTPDAAATTTQTADAVVETTYAADGANTFEIRFRVQDASNYWRLTISGSGDMNLGRFIAGSFGSVTSLGAGTVSTATHRVVLTMEGNVYNVYLDGVLKLSYTDAGNNFLAATGVDIRRVSGGVSEVVCWPRTYDFASAIAGATAQFNEAFGVDQPAGFLATRTADTGQWIIKDTNGILSTTGAELAWNGTPASGDYIATPSAVTRAVGRAFLFTNTRRTTVAGNGAVGYGWSQNPAAGYIDLGADLSAVAGSQRLWVVTGASTATLLGTFALGSGTHEFALILRGTGGFICARVAGGDWKLLWVHNEGTGNLYPALMAGSASNNNLGFANARVVDLPAPFTSDNGLASAQFSTPSSGATGAHTPDCLVDATLTLADGGADVVVKFRKKDASNYIELRVTDVGSTADYVLNKVVAGTTTELGRGNAAFGTNLRIVVVADGNTYSVFRNNALLFSATDAGSAHLLETGAEVGSTGIGALTFWPRLVPVPASV